MTDDPTRATDPGTPPQPAPGTGPWYATPETGAPAGSPAPSFIPAGINAKPVQPKSSARGGLLTGALVIAGFVAAAGLGFAGGRVTAPQQAPTGRGQGFGNGGGFPNASGRGGNGGFGGAFAAGSIAISGSIVAMGNGSITVQPAGGNGTVQIAVPATTTYHAQAAAASTDLAIGTQVQVTVNGAQFRRGGPEASGAPAASAGPGSGANGAGPGLTATDILVTGK